MGSVIPAILGILVFLVLVAIAATIYACMIVETAATAKKNRALARLYDTLVFYVPLVFSAGDKEE